MLTMPKNSGFTLIELMVVIAIIAVLSVVGVVIFTNVQKSARDAANTANVNAIAKAYETKYLNTGSYITSGSPVLDPSYFAGGTVPAPDGSNYLIVKNDTSGGLKICTPINGSTQACNEPSSTCFCKGVSQASPPDSASTNSYYSLIADGTVTTTTAPNPSPNPSPSTIPSSTPSPPPPPQNPYQYQRIVTITAAANLNNYQIPITINTASLVSAGKMKSNCSDLLVTDVGGTILPYWIETGNNCNSSSTKIWTKVPAIASNTTVKLFYGNPAATNTQNGGQVFDLFDDFSGGSIDAAKWNIVPGNIIPTQVSGELKIAGTSTSALPNSTYGVTSKATFAPSFTSEARFSTVTATNEYKASVGPGLIMLKRLSGSLKIGYYVPPPTGSGWVFPANSGYTSSGYMNFMLKIQPTKAEFFENNTLKATRNVTIASQGVSLAAGPDVANTAYDARYDWVFVRQYSASEPSISVGVEQGT